MLTSTIFARMYYERVSNSESFVKITLDFDKQVIVMVEPLSSYHGKGHYSQRMPQVGWTVAQLQKWTHLPAGISMMGNASLVYGELRGGNSAHWYDSYGDANMKTLMEDSRDHAEVCRRYIAQCMFEAGHHSLNLSPEKVSSSLKGKMIAGFGNLDEKGRVYLADGSLQRCLVEMEITSGMANND